MIRTFHGNYVKQTNGVRMGKKPDPTAASLFARSALLSMCTDLDACDIVHEIFNSTKDPHERLRLMVNGLHDGISYGNWPWAIGPANRFKTEACREQTTIHNTPSKAKGTDGS